MFSKGSEQQRSIIFNPKISFLLNEGAKDFLTFAQNIRRFKVFLVKPFLIPSSNWRVRDSSFVLNSQEKVNRRLFVRICIILLTNQRRKPKGTNQGESWYKIAECSR